MSSSSLCYQAATELADLIRGREVSARQVVSDHLDQIDRLNGDINAICTLIEPEEALKQADAIDEKIRNGDEVGPLAGLPIAIKDLVATAGIRTTMGSLLFQDHVPDTDALFVERIRNAGAIIIGKTNTPEFGAGSNTFNQVFGITRNPYDLNKTVGGSSGGAAAALASCMLPIADGSDLGGSLRNPAGFCNVVGFRPSIGRVPSYPQLMIWQSRLSTEGPMARNVRDCALLYSVMAGPDDRDPVSQLLSPATGDSLEMQTKGSVIGWSTDLGGLPVEPEITRVFNKAREGFLQLGCELDDSPVDLREAMDVFKVIRAHYYAESTRAFFPEHRDILKATLVRNIEAGHRLTGMDLSQAGTKRTKIFYRMREYFQHHDFLVVPTAQVEAFDTETEWVQQINGVELQDYIDWMSICCVVTVTGLPSISVPAGFTESGMPTGLQIIGGPGRDWDVLRMANMFERASQFGDRRPALCQPAADEGSAATL